MEETRSESLCRILDAARGEFLDKGYQKASLRQIVRSAGLTTGAFYGYFKNKEELFDALVGEQYRRLLEIYRETLQEFFQIPPDRQAQAMEACTARGVDRMMDYIYDHLEAFQLILCSSEGTAYNNLVHDMAMMDMEATHTFAETAQSIGASTHCVGPELEHILTSGMFSAFFELIIHGISREDARKYVRQLLDFYSAGWAKIMGF